MRSSTELCCLLFVVILGACSSSDRNAPTGRFELAGVRVSLPGGFVAATASENAALAPATSTSNHELAARRRTDGAVTVVLQSERLPLIASGGERVEDYLTEALAALLERQALSGTSPPRARDGGLEQCVDSRDGRGRHIRSCSHVYLDSRQFALHIVTCFAEPAQQGMCTSIVDSRVFTTTGARPLDETLRATVSPGLPEIAADSIGWIRFGMSRDEFHAACRAAGQRHDMPVAAEEPPIVHQMFRDGTMARCSGLGKLSVGEVTNVLARFHGDRLFEASLFVAAPFASVSPRIRAAYPDYIPEGDATVHYVKRAAVDSEILGISVSSSVTRPGESLLVVQSRASLDAPPL